MPDPNSVLMPRAVAIEIYETNLAFLEGDFQDTVGHALVAGDPLDTVQVSDVSRLVQVYRTLADEARQSKEDQVPVLVQQVVLYGAITEYKRR
jgi:hypothetical protein